MTTHPDYEELLRLLEEHKVDYMVVGGYAVAFHGYPRFTKDIDLFYKNSKENIKRLSRALIAFGFNESDFAEGDIFTDGNVLTFGVIPTRVDLLNHIDGVVYEEAEGRIIRGEYGSVEVNFIGREDLILNKSATPRLKDKVDIEELGG